MLYVSNWMNVDMDFRFLVGLIDRCTDWAKKAFLVKVHVLSSKLVLSMAPDKSPKYWSKRPLMEVKYRREKFKGLLMSTLSEH